MAEVAEATAIDPGVAELTADVLGPAEPSTTEQTAEVTEPTQGQSQPQAGVDQSAQAPTEQPAQKFTFGGKERTQKEIEDALTTSSQFKYLQDRYVEQKRQLDAMQAMAQQVGGQPRQPQQQAQGPQAPTVHQLRAFYEPRIKQAVARGDFSQDFAEAFGAETAQLMYGFDQLTDARQAIAHLIERVNSFERGSMESSAVSDIRQSIASLAGAGEPFAALNAQDAQQGFFDYLYQINPQVGQLRNPEFLKAQWYAYNSAAIQEQLTAATKQAAAAEAARKQSRTLARGDGAGTRPGAAMPIAPDPLADMADDLFPKLFKR